MTEIEDEHERLFREHVRDAIQAGGKSGVMSVKTGIPVGTLNKYVSLRSAPSAMNALKIARAIGLTLEELAEGKQVLGAEGDSRYVTVDHGDSYEARDIQSLYSGVIPQELQGEHHRSTSGGRASKEIAQSQELVYLPTFDARASAGNGLVASSEAPVGEMAFARNFLRNLGANPDFCYVLEARGDSMHPTIPDGAMLIGDASQVIVDDGRIYHFNVNERVLVKRARWRLDGRLYLTSDNAAAGYPDESFDADRVSELYVGGRIVFVGHAPLPTH
ncbi:S24 family peptidase [Rhizobium sp. SL86]|uniref:S24 family peptidase n=1 Tax=Rhizobium sp. SL86 TaxID=2995148 RepID=UPI0022769387|nr:S24 family peptidase [Rhizobium sp. SL86]MCY1668060.1 helix-turn-helix domain-containing protein [Rhizobium sp. SL86]